MREVLQQLLAIPDLGSDKIQHLPDRKSIVYLLKQAQVVLFPSYYHYCDMPLEQTFDELEAGIEKAIRMVVDVQSNTTLDPKKTAGDFMQALPEVKKLLLTDIQAVYDGDPAAGSKAEILLCYPGFYAVMIHRIAHTLYRLGVPYIPRVMSEYAHEKTGIDINPGASIGGWFCIDHGTGIVIGETATIGEHVKIYQGVTIGARSFEVDAEGNPVKGGKRHPDIGDRVVIYANATILGGDTRVGDDCVIGGNVWLIYSVEAGKKIYYTCK